MSTCDLAFVGSGISTTFTLVELLDLLERRGTRSARLLIVDRDPEFFTGIPYGSRSGDTGLIISRTADFLPPAALRQFAAWLAENRDAAFARFFAVGGPQVERWRVTFWDDVVAGSIGDIHLPRYVFGLYFADIARRAIERAEELGVATCDRVVGEVVDIQRGATGFELVVHGALGAPERHTAERVVLGLGSSPTRRVLEAWAEARAFPEHCALIDDPFSTGIPDMLDRIRSGTRRRPGGRVVIVGSNASALDVVFNLVNDPEIAANLGRIEVVSPSGRFPDLFEPTAARAPFEARRLERVRQQPTITADEILDAVRADLDDARAAGLTVTDTLVVLATGFTGMLERLSPEEKLRFATDTGVRIGELQRRAGRDYRELAERLTGDGTLVVSRGRVPDFDLGSDDDLVAVVNCSGSERLSSPRLGSRLLRALLDRGWLVASGSDLGVRVSDDLETDTPGVYVIGPLLTGNVIDGDPAWNLEHAGRIAAYGRRLAAHLADEAFAERAA